MSQAFTRSSTMAFSGVRENVHPNTKMELCGKMLYFIIYSFILLKCYEWLLSRFKDVSESDMLSDDVPTP